MKTRRDKIVRAVASFVLASIQIRLGKNAWWIMPLVIFGFLMVVMAYQLARHTAKMSVPAMIAIAAAGSIALGVFLRLT